MVNAMFVGFVLLVLNFLYMPVAAYLLKVH